MVLGGIGYEIGGVARGVNELCGDGSGLIELLPSGGDIEAV